MKQPLDAAPVAVLKRAEKAWSQRQLYEPLLQEVYSLFLPNREGFGQTAEGQRKDRRIYDSAPQQSVIRFANRLSGVLMPPGQHWFALKPGREIPADMRTSVDSLLRQSTDKIFDLLALSNFDQAANEMMLDLAVGTGALLIERGDETSPVRCTAVNPADIAFAEGPFGKVERVYRKLKMKAGHIRRAWGLDSLPRELADQVKRDPDADVMLTEATELDPERGDYRFAVIHPGSRAELETRRYKVSPWIIPRWQKAPGEIWGRGPACQVLADALVLNKSVELTLQNAAMAVNGPYTVADDGVLNPDSVRMTPGALIPVSRNGGPMGAPITPVPRSGDFNVANLIRDDMRQAVKAGLYDRALPPDSAGVRSATEIIERMKELQTDIGEAFGRMQTEFVWPVARRILAVLNETGHVVIPLELDGQELDLDLVSPMARAQQMSEVQNVIQYLQMLGSLGPSFMEAGIKSDALPPWLAQKLGVPMDLLPSPEELQASREAQQQQQQAAMMAQSPVAAQIAGAGIKMLAGGEGAG